MAEIWIPNASPIITLAKIDHLHLLAQLASDLRLPEVVAGELRAGRHDDPARRAIDRGWAREAPTPPIPEKILEWGLGAGESAVLATALAHEEGVAILDDATARKCAAALGLKMMGTLGVVVQAKLRELIPSAAAVIRSLRDAGLFLDDETIRSALTKIGEEPL